MMSQNLFKLYNHELSMRMSDIEEVNVFLPNGYKISHLLWADDLEVTFSSGHDLKTTKVARLPALLY